jgi:phosphatidylglycerol:prolipoprotein diacylglycerol transferase
MQPVIFYLWKLPIHGYGLMIVLGFLLATYVAAREARRRGLPDFVYDLGMVMLLSGILGGRIFYYLQFYQEEYATESFWEFFKLWEGGLVFYGGAVGGFLGGLSYLYIKKLPILDCLDICALGAPIGMGIGRLGCYLNGCCFGRLCGPDSPLGVLFPQKSAVHRQQEEVGLITSGDPTLPVHPVQLYQAGHDLLLFAILWAYLHRASPPRGVAMPLLFVLYGIGRFFLEGLRADNALTGIGLTISQYISLALVAVFGAALVVTWRRGVKTYQPSP